ncbi:MAG: hypothetical protein GTN39_01920 [Candidatus Aenigmarchaeota archaeon]|nr:hypothetical protein [Candidatus Aenigmarchaeota archaeon]
MRTEDALKELLLGMRELLRRRDETEGFIDLKRASAFSSLGGDTLRRLIRDGRLRGYQVVEGGKILVKKSDLSRVLEEGELKAKDKVKKMWRGLKG